MTVTAMLICMATAFGGAGLAVALLQPTKLPIPAAVRVSPRPRPR